MGGVLLARVGRFMDRIHHSIQSTPPAFLRHPQLLVIAQDTFFNDNTIDWDTFSADSIYYRVGSKYSNYSLANPGVSWSLSTNSISNPHDFTISVDDAWLSMQEVDGVLLAKGPGSGVLHIQVASTRPIHVNTGNKPTVVMMDQH
ncbi:MAG TPA: hypothetical protein VHM90_16735, partial [Phycisphaerae bacterium]|nr:hypothetical protein [Phycisphaerae bacterium]